MGGRGGRGRGGGPGAPTELSVLYCALREAVVNVGQDKFGQLLLICSGGDKMASMPGENVAIRRQNSLRRSLRTTPHRTYSVIVTEKDAVKLRPELWAQAGSKTRIWVAPLDFECDAAFLGELRALLPPSPSIRTADGYPTA